MKIPIKNLREISRHIESYKVLFGPYVNEYDQWEETTCTRTKHDFGYSWHFSARIREDTIFGYQISLTPLDIATGYDKKLDRITDELLHKIIWHFNDIIAQYKKGKPIE